MRQYSQEKPLEKVQEIGLCKETKIGKMSFQPVVSLSLVSQGTMKCGLFHKIVPCEAGDWAVICGISLVFFPNYHVPGRSEHDTSHASLG